MRVHAVSSELPRLLAAGRCRFCPRRLRQATASSRRGAKNTFGKSSPTLPATGRRGEKERERGRGAVRVRVCVSVCPAERKTRPPAILATIRAEDRDIAHWNTTVPKVRKLLSSSLRSCYNRTAEIHSRRHRYPKEPGAFPPPRQNAPLPKNQLSTICHGSSRLQKAAHCTEDFRGVKKKKKF